MKQLTIIIFSLLFLTNNIYAWCLWKNIGTTCEEKRSDFTTFQWWKEKLKIKSMNNEDNSNEKNRGYKLLLVGATSEFWNVPYQQQAERVNQFETNYSVSTELNLNKNFSFKIQQSQFNFLDSNNEDYMYKHRHTFGLFVARIYILNNYFMRAGIGFGQSEINYQLAQNVNSNLYPDHQNKKFSGYTSVFQFSIGYYFNNEACSIALISTSIHGHGEWSGETNETLNLGASSYGLSFSAGFF